VRAPRFPRQVCVTMALGIVFSLINARWLANYRLCKTSFRF
jgi:hypothetical protein